MGDAKPEEKLPFMEPTPEMEAMMKKMNYGLIKVRPLKNWQSLYKTHSSAKADGRKHP